MDKHDERPGLTAEQVEETVAELQAIAARVEHLPRRDPRRGI